MAFKSYEFFLEWELKDGYFYNLDEFDILNLHVDTQNQNFFELSIGYKELKVCNNNVCIL
jgi:hypothetical protein